MLVSDFLTRDCAHFLHLIVPLATEVKSGDRLRLCCDINASYCYSVAQSNGHTPS